MPIMPAKRWNGQILRADLLDMAALDAVRWRNT